jgi:hypothetical protein
MFDVVVFIYFSPFLKFECVYTVENCSSSVLMRFLCKTSHKDSCAWPCLTWHCQPIKSAEYNQRETTIVSDCEHKNVFLHIPGLKFTQIKILWNVVDVFGTLTTWRHMMTSSLKCKDQAFFGVVFASILIKYN